MKHSTNLCLLMCIISFSIGCSRSSLTQQEAELRLEEAGVQYKYLFMGNDGMIHLDLSGCNDPDFVILRSLPISTLKLSLTEVKDLSPLAGMQLKTLFIDRTEVVDLLPVKDLPLKNINMSHCQKIVSIAPLKGLSLHYLNIADTGIQDLSVLEGMPLRGFTFSPEKITNGLEIIKNMTTLKSIGTDGIDEKGAVVMHCCTPEMFWRQYDKGNLFGKKL